MSPSTGSLRLRKDINLASNAVLNAAENILCANPLENRAFQDASESALEICSRKAKMVW